MTNEEAIKELELIARVTVWNNRREAIEMAIEALQHDTVEVVRCKDCLMHGVCRFEHGLGLDGYCSQAGRRTDG